MKPPANAIVSFAAIAALIGMAVPVYGSFVSLPMMVLAIPFSLWAYGTDTDRSVATKGKIALGLCGISLVIQAICWMLAFS